MVTGYRFPALLLAAGLLCAPARANDSASELDAGGLILRPEPGIALASEDLSIGLERIDVAYVFRSQVNEPRTVRIAFPLPPIDGRLSASRPSSCRSPSARTSSASPLRSTAVPSSRSWRSAPSWASAR
jgi:hypothetical protein